MTEHIDAARLSEFSPFDALKTDNLSSLTEQVEIRQASQGEALFKKGDSDKRAFYLLSGTVELTGDDTVQLTITGGTDEANSPIAPGSPRRQTAVALDSVRYFTIDSELLDVTLTLDQTGIYEVGDFSSGLDSGEGDWMTALLHTQVFQQIPPQCLQMIFARLQRVDFKAGDMVIQQGSKGDYFYVIRSGRCLVTRETPAGRANINLAELGVGGTFGEEALLSEAERNATVSMQTDGILMSTIADHDQHGDDRCAVTAGDEEEGERAEVAGGREQRPAQTA